MDKQLLFISHKHSDAKIAKCIADFVREKSLNGVEVHVSSDPDSKAPMLGKNINEELRKALKKAAALILIYTTDDKDWSYCMWECGVATDPDSLSTNILVFQCGINGPSPFSDVLRVDARKRDDIRRFTDVFFRDPQFFPERRQAIAPDFTKQQTDKLADGLYQELQPLLPPLEPTEEWSAWPYLCVELPRDKVEQLRARKADTGEGSLNDIVRNHAIVCGGERAPHLFGMTSFPERIPLQELMNRWSAKLPNAEPDWFDSCCQQILLVVKRELPVIPLTPFKEVDGNSEYVCVVSRVYDKPAENRMQVDIHFYNVTDPRAIPVTSKMLRKGSFFSKNLGETPPSRIKLRVLLKELVNIGRHRVPVLNENGHPLYIIHRSMIDRFMVKRLMEDPSSPNDELTLEDLFAEPSMKRMFEATFAVVGKRATLAEASSAMRIIADCRDVFVTERGSRDEPVIGWLTNVRMADIG